VYLYVVNELYISGIDDGELYTYGMIAV